MAPANKRRNFSARLLFGILVLASSWLTTAAAESCPERVYFPFITNVASNNTGVPYITLNGSERNYISIAVPQIFYGALERAELEIVTTAIVAPIPVTYDVYLASGRDYTNLLSGPKVGSVAHGPDTASPSMTAPLNEAFLAYLRQAAEANTNFVFLEFGARLSAPPQTHAQIVPTLARFKLGITPTSAPVFSIEPQHYETVDDGV